MTRPRGLPSCVVNRDSIDASLNSHQALPNTHASTIPSSALSNGWSGVADPTVSPRIHSTNMAAPYIVDPIATVSTTNRYATGTIARSSSGGPAIGGQVTTPPAKADPPRWWDTQIAVETMAVPIAQAVCSTPSVPMSVAAILRTSCVASSVTAESAKRAATVAGP